MQRLLAFAVGIELLGQRTDAGLLGVGGVGERKCVKTRTFVVNRVVSNA
jgi:hypothetical protein